MIFIMASALSPNVGAQVTFRLIAGFFGSTPLTCAGGSLSDIWNPVERGLAVPLFAIIIFCGSVIGPIGGGWIVDNGSITWRWVDWVTLIVAGVILILTILFLPETYAPMLLSWKAKHLRAVTGNDKYRSPLELRQDTLGQRVGAALTRPFGLLFREPIVMAMALYLTVVFVVMYTTLVSYISVFSGVYGWSPGMTGTVFVASMIGLALPGVLLPGAMKKARAAAAKRQAAGDFSPAPPENKLLLAMIGAPGIPISLFWIGMLMFFPQLKRIEASILHCIRANHL